MIPSNLVGSGKAENVSCLVLATKGLVQAAQRWIVSQQHIDIAFEADSGAGAVKEACQAGL